MMKKTILTGLVLGMILGTKVTQATDVSGIISSNTIWDLAGSPYIATDTVTVAEGVALTIQPNVVVKFATGTSLISYGTLNAVGDSAGTITFTSDQATHTAGHWNGIKLSGSGANGGQISYCDIGYAEQAVYLENVSQVTITHNYIHDNKGADGPPVGDMGCGLYLKSSFEVTISNNIIQNNKGGEGGAGGGKGGMGIGMYVFQSGTNTISKNAIANNVGGNGIAGADPRDGGMGVGIYLFSSENTDISENTIDNNVGGGGGHGFGQPGGVGAGIYVFSSTKTTIFKNSLSNNKGGNGGGGIWYGATGGVGAGIYVSSSNDAIILQNVIRGSEGGIAGYSHDWCSGYGGVGAGVYFYSSNNVVVSQNTIENAKGGACAGRHDLGGGVGAGVYFHLSNNIAVKENSICQSIGGWGGDGIGGIGAGAYLVLSNNNIISEGNTIIDSTGGTGNPDGDGIGIYCQSSEVTNLIYNNIYNNQTYNLQTDISPGSQTVTYNWWGTINEPDIEAKLNGNSIYKPYLMGTYTGPNISVSPSFGLIGITVTVEGVAFATQTQVTISFGISQTITTTTSSPNGTFSTTFIVDTQTPGTKVITAIDTEGNLATTTFILFPPTFLKIVPAYNLIAKNQEFDLDVRIDDVRDLAVAETLLSFNPNVLEVLSITQGSFPSGAGIVKSHNNTTGSIYYFAGLFTGSATGSGVLCSIRFRGKEGGSSTLVFGNNTILADDQSSSIPFNKEQGLYYIATSLSVLPENQAISAGNSQSYSAFAICETGSVNVTGSATFTATGGGSFTTNIFEAHYIGTYTIQADFLGLIGTTNVTITPGTPTALLYESGNNQISTCTTTLSNPFIVKVEDVYHNPCSNVSVSFVVISSPLNAEGYSLSSTQDLTNINGTTSTYLTLGDEPPGSYTIRATSGILSPVDFTAWSLRRIGNIAGICLIDYGTEAQRTASITVTLIETSATTTTNSNSYFIFNNLLVYSKATGLPKIISVLRTA
ncbi:MAG: right-handed parallel beta-helix repeat-containing protein, partial [bacterium]|nr:right-handed parallel beta-helix repeat-containing protein [bacterium]